MNIWEALAELSRQAKLHARGDAAQQRYMPSLDEAAYRIAQLRAGTPVSAAGPGMGIPVATGEDYLSGLLDAVTPVPVGPGMVQPLTGAKSFIRDWRWRPEREVQQALNLQDLPEHIEPFGEFMKEQAEKAAGPGLTPRDLIKAYTTTRSSIQRTALKPETVDPSVRWAAEEGRVRPEDAFGAWLFTPHGQSYLNHAEKGLLDQDAIADAMRIIKPFGRDRDLGKALVWAVENLPGREASHSKVISEAYAGQENMNEWLKEIADYAGISSSKAGFYGSLLGYGRLPTLDARQLAVHGITPAQMQKFGARGRGEGASQAVAKLARRQKNLDVGLPEGMEPFRQHLTHHAVWDTAGNDRIRHEAVMRAMRNAGIGVLGITPVLSGLLGEDDSI